MVEGKGLPGEGLTLLRQQYQAQRIVFRYYPVEGFFKYRRVNRAVNPRIPSNIVKGDPGMEQLIKPDLTLGGG